MSDLYVFSAAVDFGIFEQGKGGCRGCFVFVSRHCLLLVWRGVMVLVCLREGRVASREGLS